MSGRRASRRNRISAELISSYCASCGEPVMFVASDPVSRAGAPARQLIAVQPVASPLRRARVAADTSREERER